MTEPQITPELVAAHGIAPDEHERLLAILGRDPSHTELGIFSAMWNEHCSYKSSKKWLRTLPTEGPQVICEPGENAGIVDIGDGLALVFKMESHNHPSQLNPFHGAATGVGGILRDVFTMGARPVAAMNALSFGSPDAPRTKELLQGAVAGIADYAGTVGLPMAGGELRFHPSYDGNCLVNAFAAGIVRKDAIFYSAASGVGMPIVYLGGRTGREGVGGATMASAEFGSGLAIPKTQTGDAELGRAVMEASLELMASGAVIAIQDMGAAGLTCSAVEMGDKGGLGIRLDLDRVPLKEPDLSAYEMMLSESQERMLVVLRPGHEDEAREIFTRRGLEFQVIGETMAEDRFLVMHGNEVKADLPLSKLASSAPEYDRPWVESPAPAPLPDIPEISAMDALRALISSVNHGSRAGLVARYAGETDDTLLRASGNGAGVIRIDGTDSAIAFTSDVTPRYVAADPREGGRQAVAEAFRNLVAVGAKPLAATDNLNFGNPEKPEVMGQLVGAIKGIGDACRALSFPIVSGNVSLYNETEGVPIQPTPTIGGVGLVATDKIITGPAQAGDTLVLIGTTRGHLGQSALLAEAFGIEAGTVPPVDLQAEAAHGAFVLEHHALIRAATDLGDGGLALAAFELAAAAGVGFSLHEGDISSLFGEDQARYLLATDNPEALLAAAQSAGVPAAITGRIGGGEARLGSETAEMAPLVALWEGALDGLLG